MVAMRRSVRKVSARLWTAHTTGVLCTGDDLHIAGCDLSRGDVAQGAAVPHGASTQQGCRSLVGQPCVPPRESPWHGT